MSLQLFFFVALYIFWHACEKNCRSTCFFVFYVAMHYIYLLGHQPVQPRIVFLWTLLDDVWHFYHTIIGCLFVSLWFLLFFVYPINESTVILYAYFCLISLEILLLPTQWSTCCRSFAMLIVSIGSPCSPSIYAVATMYDYLYLRR